MIRPSSLFLRLASLFAGAALVAPAAAQIGSPFIAQGPPSQIPVALAKRFTWQDDVSTSTGLVMAQWPLAHGWGVVGDKFQYRLVPSWSSDPTVEVVLFPPYSGHPTKLERFLIQFPAGSITTPPSEKALVVGFHPFSQSEKSVFNGTILPELCAQRGWVLIAAYGLIDTSFGNMPSQISLDAIVELVWKVVPFNRQRVYTVGFSMGGTPAVNWALRRQDPRDLRVAGVICHTGTLDLIREYEQALTSGKQLLADPDHFGGTPTQVPFEYERVSAFQMIGDQVDPAQAYVDNLRHIPIYLHWNVKDPNVDLVIRNRSFRDHLLANGSTLQVHTASTPLVHHWSTLPMRPALEWISRFTLPDDPLDVRMHAPDAGHWLFAEIRRKNPTEHARFSVRGVSVAQNSFTVDETYDLDEIALDLGAMGLDPAALLRVTHQSGDGTGDRVVLEGYATAPSSVLFNFAAPVAWSHDPLTQELTVDPSPTGALGVIQVFP